MSYLSFTFAAFMLVLLGVYHLISQKVRGGLLLCASLVFYAWHDTRYLLFLLFAAASTFLCARGFSRFRRKKLLLILCAAANAAVWLAAKVFPWLFLSLRQLLQLPEPGWSMLVPLGISYYTLQAIAYVADVYTGKTTHEKNFWKYLLFLAYFPAVVQGPISRYDQLRPQLQEPKQVSYDSFCSGLLLILFGLVKKMVLADRLGILADYCFTNAAELHGVILYVGALCYAIQLYADFSGCVDICRGVSSLLGIELIQNFRSPYLSGSIKEFWSRWHISLSTWLKDYIYIPLGGNRRGTLRKYINLLITFTISGIWHGAGLNFLVWGLLHGAYQIVGECTAAARSKLKTRLGIQPDSLSDRIYKTVITFHLVAFAWIFFRADSLMSALQYIGNMVSRPELWRVLSSEFFAHGVTQNAFTLMLLHVGVMFYGEHLTGKHHNIIADIRGLHLVLRWSIYLLLIFDVLLCGVYGSGYSVSSFLYGGF